LLFTNTNNTKQAKIISTQAADHNGKLELLFHYDNSLDPSICSFSFQPSREMLSWVTDASTALVKRHHTMTLSPFWTKQVVLAKKCTTWIRQRLQFSPLARFLEGLFMSFLEGLRQDKYLFLTRLHLQCFKTLYFSLWGSILTAVGGCHPHNWLQKFLQALIYFLWLILLW